MAKYVTAQRTALLSLLKSARDKRLSAKEIHNMLNDDKISLSAVYRNLSDLADEGVISRFAKDKERGFYYQYIANEECKNAIHLTCTKCGRVTHMESAEADSMANALLKTTGFSINKSKTVLYGVCKKCE